MTQQPGAHPTSWPSPEPGGWPTPPQAPPGAWVGTRATDPAGEIIGGGGVPGLRRYDPTPQPAPGGPPARPLFGEWSRNDVDEHLGPLLPRAPVTRPPERQARIVLALIAGLVLIGLMLSLLALRGLINGAGTGASTGGPASAASGSVGGTRSHSSTAPGTGGAASAIDIARVTAIDPQGDGSENSAGARNAVDGNPATEWRSERYNSARFGGLGKKGVGLVLDLGERATVSQVVLDERGTGGVVELRTSDTPQLDGSSVVQSIPLTNGRLTIQLSRPVPARYVILWFTAVPRQPSGEYRLRVFEVSVR